MGDYYSYYVLILGIPDTVFWRSDHSFLNGIAENKAAYDRFVGYKAQQEKAKSKKN